MRKGKHALPAALAVAAVAALAVATTAPAGSDATGPIKAAWIYVGPHNDGGWSQAHDRGRLAVEKALGKNVVTTYKEKVPEGPQASQVIDSLVRDGNKIIFATSFGYMDAMEKAAKKYPEVYFEHATGYKTGRNFANYFGAGEDAIYLSGIAAGAATKSGTVGYIVPFPIPEIIRHANAFALGVQLVRPDAKISLVSTKSWLDHAKERKAAESLVAAGADVIDRTWTAQRRGGTCSRRGSRGSATTATRASSRRRRGSSPRSTTGASTTRSASRPPSTGTWKTGSYWGSMADGFTLLSSYGPKVSAKTKALIAKKRAQIIKGTFYEFQGPLYDQQGKLRVPKGKEMSLQDILTVDWLVKGIEGSPKG